MRYRKLAARRQITQSDLIAAYCQWAEQHWESGWPAFLLTFLFEELGGNTGSMHARMVSEVERVYAQLLTRIVRNPNTGASVGMRPIWIGFPDYPVAKKDKVDARVVQVNDGRHIHMLAFNPPVSRMKEDFADHIDENQQHYARSPLFRVHVEPVTERPGNVLDYIAKSAKRDRAGFRLSLDDVIILPRVTSEMPGY
jgi:hypothetical protein